MERLTTGIAGLDAILGGGLPHNHLYLIQGTPGTGKTTLALQFLLEGAARGERGLYVTLSESATELRGVAESHGWSLEKLSVCDLQSTEISLTRDAQYIIFHPSEIELGHTAKTILDEVERTQPKRVVFDSLSEVRLLARDSLRYRRQMLELKHDFARKGITVLLLDTLVKESDESQFQLESVAHGVITLEQLAPEYGGQRRRLRVQKIRGIHFRDGFHDFTIRKGGLVVYPRLVASDEEEPFATRRHPPVPGGAPLSTANAELDALLGGGLDRGTSTLLLGPSGVGKSSLALQITSAALRAGEAATVYVFDETPQTWFRRARSLGFDVQDSVASGQLVVRAINPAELSPGAFANLVGDAIERRHSRMIVIDSLNGYVSAMSEERMVTLHLHELLTYLANQGIVTVAIMAQHGLVGGDIHSDLDISYVSDAVVLLRFFEAGGAVRRAVSVVKKRTGRHEQTVREIILEKGGIRIGAQISEFNGVLTGNPVFTGRESHLFSRKDA